MFFARPNEYEPCGIFTTKHFILIILTIAAISVALKKTVNKKQRGSKKIIKKTNNNNLDTRICKNRIQSLHRKCK